MQIDAAGDAGHERLGVVGQAFEDPHQIAQDFVRLGDVEPGGRGGGGYQRFKGQEAAGDVLQGDGLQLGAPLEGLHEYGQSGFNRFAALRQAVQESGAIEVVERGHARGVGLRLQVAPLGQLRQRRVDLFNAWRRIRPARLGLHFIGPQLQAVLPLGGGEHFHDAAVDDRLLGTDMPEQLGRLVCDRHAAASWVGVCGRASGRRTAVAMVMQKPSRQAGPPDCRRPAGGSRHVGAGMFGIGAAARLR